MKSWYKMFKANESWYRLKPSHLLEGQGSWGSGWPSSLRSPSVAAHQVLTRCGLPPLPPLGHCAWQGLKPVFSPARLPPHAIPPSPKTSLICIASTMFQLFSNIVKNIEVDVFFRTSPKNDIVKNWETSHR